MNRSHPDYLQIVRRLAMPIRPRRRSAPRVVEHSLDTLRIDELRQAIRTNQVTFPAPVPTFRRHDRADLQWRLAQLYFVRGWHCETIAAKYGLIHQRVRQILKAWMRRAVATGYIQFIPAAGVLTPVMQPLAPSVNLSLAPRAAPSNTNADSCLGSSPQTGLDSAGKT
jgi:hypothetical protein